MCGHGFWPPAAPVVSSALPAQQLQWQAASELLVIVPVQLRLLSQLLGQKPKYDSMAARSDEC